MVGPPGPAVDRSTRPPYASNGPAAATPPPPIAHTCVDYRLPSHGPEDRGAPYRITRVLLPSRRPPVYGRAGRLTAQNGALLSSPHPPRRRPCSTTLPVQPPCGSRRPGGSAAEGRSARRLGGQEIAFRSDLARGPRQLLRRLRLQAVRLAVEVGTAPPRSLAEWLDSNGLDRRGRGRNPVVCSGCVAPGPCRRWRCRGRRQQR